MFYFWFILFQGCQYCGSSEDQIVVHHEGLTCKACSKIQLGSVLFGESCTSTNNNPATEVNFNNKLYSEIFNAVVILQISDNILPEVLGVFNKIKSYPTFRKYSSQLLGCYALLQVSTNTGWYRDEKKVVGCFEGVTLKNITHLTSMLNKKNLSHLAYDSDKNNTLIYCLFLCGIVSIRDIENVKSISNNIFDKYSISRKTSNAVASYFILITRLSHQKACDKICKIFFLSKSTLKKYIRLCS